MKPKKSAKKTPLEKDWFELSEQIGKFMEYWGFKKIHGKIWSYLYLSPMPLAAVTLSERLGVSKTLMSFAMNELLKYEVIIEAAKGPKRTVYYEANPDLSAVILNVLQKRELQMMHAIQSAYQQLAQQDTSTFTDPQHLKNLGEFIETATQVLEFCLSLQMQPGELKETLGFLKGSSAGDVPS